MNHRACISLALILCFAASIPAQEIRIPAFTAYISPTANAARVTKEGITNWSTADTILWGGMLSPGTVKLAIVIKLPRGESATLRATTAGHSQEATLTGTGDPATVDFGDFAIPASPPPSATPAYQRIELAGLRKTGKTFGDILELVLTGPATKDAFFNLKPRRNAPSVHLNYPLDKNTQAQWFYNELIPREDPVATYYQACGFARGYFGMQVNSPKERRIIFSVWDAGKEAVDRKNVADTDRVKLLAKGEGVIAGDFGNEGTGGHSHLIYPWKVGQPQRFLVTAKADGDATIYSGYFYFDDRHQWGLIASFRAPHDGKLLRGLYSFNENFDGSNGNLRRLCEFGNQWIKSTDNKWTELTTATFSHDPTGNKDRRDFAAGLTPTGRFYLSNGGFIAEPIKYGQRFTRPPTAKPPTEIILP